MLKADHSHESSPIVGAVFSNVCLNYSLRETEVRKVGGLKIQHMNQDERYKTSPADIMAFQRSSFIYQQEAQLPQR